jgi:hypothetical protein
VLTRGAWRGADSHAPLLLVGNNDQRAAALQQVRQRRARTRAADARTLTGRATVARATGVARTDTRAGATADMVAIILEKLVCGFGRSGGERARPTRGARVAPIRGGTVSEGDLKRRARPTPQRCAWRPCAQPRRLRRAAWPPGRADRRASAQLAAQGALLAYAARVALQRLAGRFRASARVERGLPPDGGTP